MIDYSKYVLKSKTKKDQKQNKLGLKKSNPKFKRQIHLVAKFSSNNKYHYITKTYLVTGNDEKYIVENRFIEDIHYNYIDNINNINNIPSNKLYLNNICSNGKIISKHININNILL
jgi:hypothetical protein